MKEQSKNVCHVRQGGDLWQNRWKSPGRPLDSVSMGVSLASCVIRGRSTPDGATHFASKGSLEGPLIDIAAGFLDLHCKPARQREWCAASFFS